MESFYFRPVIYEYVAKIYHFLTFFPKMCNYFCKAVYGGKKSLINFPDYVNFFPKGFILKCINKVRGGGQSGHHPPNKTWELILLTPLPQNYK